MKKQQLSEVEIEWPLLDPKDLRRELFKYYYSQQQIEKFGLYAKADAAEFMQSFLELLHHCLNKSKQKKKVDDRCEPLCYVHSCLHIQIEEVYCCVCDPAYKKSQPGDNNLFQHIISAYEIIQDIQDKAILANNQISSDKDIGKIHSGIMPQLWKYKNSGEGSAVARCIKDDSSVGQCKKRQTIKQTFANKPYPEIFLINVNWHSDHVSYMETFFFSVSIAQQFKVSDMFDI